MFANIRSFLDSIIIIQEQMFVKVFSNKLSEYLFAFARYLWYD